MSIEQDIDALTTAINALTMAVGKLGRPNVTTLGRPNVTTLGRPNVTTLSDKEFAAKGARPHTQEPVAEDKVTPEGDPEKLAERVEATQAPAEEAPAEEAPAKPKRKRRTKAEMEAARTAEAEAKAGVEKAKAEVAEERAEAAKVEAVEMLEDTEEEEEPEKPVKQLSYDDDLRPRVAAFANAQPANERRDAMIALFAKVGMPNGTELARNPDLFVKFDAALIEVGY